MKILFVALFLLMENVTFASGPGLALDCPGDISLSHMSKAATTLNFTEKNDTSEAHLNGMKECQSTAGKFYCYQARSETMINLPLDIFSKHQGDSVVIFINDDADDVSGTGKSYKCTVK
jgi:hypothetical protein